MALQENWCWTKESGSTLNRRLQLFLGLVRVVPFRRKTFDRRSFLSTRLEPFDCYYLVKG
jgi:hypothetical protein